MEEKQTYAKPPKSPALAGILSFFFPGTGALYNGQPGKFLVVIVVTAIMITMLAQEVGINCCGPFPADTLFVHAARGAYDGVVAMYHDQGLIPVKLLAMDQAVNVTIGIPIIRTSPAHGTAFDIAGKGIAREDSMKQAIRTAVEMAAVRRKRSAVKKPNHANQARH